MTNDEALKLALEYAKPSVISPGWTLVRNEDITALREALAEQPAQRTWVGLTDEEANELWESTDIGDDWELMKRTEAKLKEKNT